MATRKLALCVLLITATLVFSTLAIAGTDSMRSEFKDALKAAQHGQLSAHSKALADLRNYPLYNYLIAAELRHDLGAKPDSALDTRIAKFVAAHPTLPPARRLRSNWLASLAQRHRWQQVIDHTRDSDGTAAQCRLAHARIEIGQAPTNDALSLYLVGKNQPAACNPVFDWLKKNGQLTASVIRKRAYKAVLDNHYSLAHYLAGRMPTASTPEIDTWLNLARHPARLADADAGLDGEIAVHVFKRLALRDVDTAAALIKPLVARLGLNNEQRYQMRRYVALLFAEEHRPEALLWFARIDHSRMAGDEHALGWEIRAAIYQKRWPIVLDTINSLPTQMAQKEEWQYWKARALAAVGQKAQAKAIYGPLSKHRSYYGYLAADRLGRAYSFNAHPLPENPSALASLETHPALARARELHALGMKHYAYLEWRQLTSKLDKPELAQAARLAFEWGWYARAIVTLAKSDYWDDLDIRYPILFMPQVRKAAGNNSLDPAYILAIIRTESLFQPTARSSVGARGLMQLMPGTAGHVARALNMSAPSASDLNNPAVNIRLGSRYLRDMLNDWSGNIALATASYNAGPNKVAEWIPERALPSDIWIDNITYTQTRHYVKRVMSHMTVFQHRLHEQVTPLDQRIHDIETNYPDDKQTTF